MSLCLNGLPSYDTLNRVFRFLDPKEFNRCFMEWVNAIAGHIQGVIAIDGKTLCNSGDEFRTTKPIHLINAFAAENQLILGQLATEAKSNEITAIPEFLKLLTINGSIITIDAMGCQKDIVQQIKSQEGEYVIALKGNQGNLHAEIENFFQQARVENKVHGHIDVTFGEDQSKIRAGHGAENVSLMRKCALNLLKLDTSVKAGVENKRKMAGWNPDYLLKILGVK